MSDESSAFMGVPPVIERPELTKLRSKRHQVVNVALVKRLVKENGLRSGRDYLAALGERVLSLIGSSVLKVKTDGRRRTLGIEDL